MPYTSTKITTSSRLPALVVGAMGVVYGDIGTSPLYTLKEVFSEVHHLPLNELNILGILSIIFWSLIIVVSLKYIIFVMSADNNGEGGVMALTALALRGVGKFDQKYMVFMWLGIFAAGLFYGDSVITPAISVLGAIEGLQVITPSLHFLVLPLTVGILVILFVVQHKGTATVGRYFGPIMIIWFFTIGVLGILSIVQNSSVIRALNPYYAVLFFIENKWIGFIALGATYLALTGAEAIYADMGHFGIKPIRLAWFSVVLPSLLCNYFGQGALLLKDPTTISNPFYLLAPNWMLYPLLILAAIATIIASQAVISGTFSMTQEAVRLGYLPRLEVHYTSEDEKGQIYIPTINWLLFILVILVVLEFESTSNLAAAYGLSVSGTMIITTFLAYSVVKKIWQLPSWQIASVFAFFLFVDSAFLGANLTKFKDGGWLPFIIAIMVMVIMMTWRSGIDLLKECISEGAIPLDRFLKNIATLKVKPVNGTSIFFTSNPTNVPPTLLFNIEHNKVLHERVVILNVNIKDIPHVPDSEKIEVTDLPNNFHVATIFYGYKDNFNIPETLQLFGSKKGLPFYIFDTIYFVGKESLVCSDVVDMPQWRKRLFIGMFRNAASFTSYCKIPYNSMVELGIKLEF